MDDAQVQQQLISVLAEYEVTVPVGHIRHNAIEFWLNNKRIVHQFDRNGNVEADLRETLRGLGAQPKPRTFEPPVIETTEIPSTMAEDIPMPEIPMPQPVPEMPTPEKVVEAPESPTARIYNDQGSTKVYQSARVIAIEMDRDLTIPKGHMLVIPLNRPNTLIDMPRDQFEVLFDTTEAAEMITPSPPLVQPYEPVVQPFEPAQVVPPALPLPRRARPDTAKNKENFENDILAYLKQRRGAVKAKVIAAALHRPIYLTEIHLRALLGRGIVECPQTGFWAIAKGAAPTKPAEEPLPAPPVDKVPPQMMRILTVMAYVSKTKRHLTSQDVTPLLIERDARQYGARMPGAIERGLVERGRPLSDTRGFHHCITPLGLAAVKDHGAWAYENDELPVPDWLASL